MVLFQGDIQGHSATPREREAQSPVQYHESDKNCQSLSGWHEAIDLVKAEEREGRHWLVPRRKGHHLQGKSDPAPLLSVLREQSEPRRRLKILPEVALQQHDSSCCIGLRGRNLRHVLYFRLLV